MAHLPLGPHTHHTTLASQPRLIPPGQPRIYLTKISCWHLMSRISLLALITVRAFSTGPYLKAWCRIFIPSFWILTILALAVVIVLSRHGALLAVASKRMTSYRYLKDSWLTCTSRILSSMYRIIRIKFGLQQKTDPGGMANHVL